MGRLAFAAGILTAALVTAVHGQQFKLQEPDNWKLPFYDFCNRVPAECAPYDDADPVTVKLTPQLKAQLAAVGLAVNRETRWQSDFEHYGQADYWTYPISGRGDCEDFALEKRRRLVAAGWPRRALRLVILHLRGRDPGDLHMVLVADTSAGKLVLDQHTDAILDLDHAKEIERVVAEQSPLHPRRWMEIAPIAVAHVD